MAPRKVNTPTSIQRHPHFMPTKHKFPVVSALVAPDSDNPASRQRLRRCQCAPQHYTAPCRQCGLGCLPADGVVASRQLLQRPLCLLLVFYVDSRYIQTRNNLITPASSLKLSVVNCSENSLENLEITEHRGDDAAITSLTEERDMAVQAYI